mgnify:CR=1 FL=1
MASVNKVILIGNLGQPPDVRITNSGSKVAEISLATTSYFTRDNERVEKTQWHTVTLWNKLAEIVERYTGKGSSVYIRGRLETEKWRIKTAKTDTQPKSLLNRFSYWAATHGDNHEIQTSRRLVRNYGK